MSSLQEMYIRIHPRSKATKGGHRVQRYSIYGHLFLEEEGWYRCSFSPEQWNQLKRVLTNSENPDSKPVFDICTEAQRSEIEFKERQTLIKDIAPMRTPVDMTTKDLVSAESGEIVAAKERERDERIANADGDIAPPAETIAKRKPGRPRKVSATEG